MKYDVDHFINKFEAIPDELWTTGKYNDGDKCCALGHCGQYDAQSHYNEETKALGLLFSVKYDITLINDGKCDRYKQSTPKARILTALKDLKTDQ